MRPATLAVLAAPVAPRARAATPSIFDPASPSAEAVRDLGAWMFGGAALILVFVTVLALLAWRGRGTVRPRLWIFGGGVLFPAIVLSGLLAYSIAVSRQFSTPPIRDLSVASVIGHMWWWQVTYRDPASGRELAAANELRIPVGRPVVVGLSSADVIHSFWIPQLGGKVDMLPGGIGQLTLHADRPGVYRGQCAEFCGEQHARMALHVVALPQDEYDAWLAREAAPAAQPASPGAARGRDAFVELRCGACHTVRGVVEGGELGPDLTHVGGRLRLAAGTVPLGFETLRAWVADPQAIKPGARMPSYTHVDAQVLDDLARYLSELK